MALFFIKQNDTAPELEAVLYEEEGGDVMNLSGATVVFNMRQKSSLGVQVSRQPCTVVDALNGVVRYSWSVGDTDTVGTFIGEFEVTYASGSVETFPHSGYITIVISDDIA